MQTLGEIYNQPRNNYSSIVNKNLNNYSSIEETKHSLTKNQADRIIETVADLIDDPKYKPFFFKRLYVIGPTNFLTIYDQAKKGKFPSRLFVSLLK